MIMEPLAINRTICVDKLEEQDNPLFIQMAKRVLERDKNTCQLCDFASSKMQQVVTVNNRYENKDFTLSNMKTVCPYCFLGQRLGHAALYDNKITFIYLPEISQADLNNLQRLMCFYDSHPQITALLEKDELTDEEQSLVDFQSHVEAFTGDLEQRVTLVQKAYRHANLSDLKMLVTMLYEASESDYANRMKFFEPMRYLVDLELCVELNKIYSKENFRSLDGHKELLFSQCLDLTNLSEK